jgi:hypothetical protein
MQLLHEGLYVQLVGLQLMFHSLQALLPEASVIFCCSLQERDVCC